MSLKQMGGNSPRNIYRKTPLVTPKLCLDMLRRKCVVRWDVNVNVFEPCGIIDHVKDEAAFHIS
jgi:hypothetical protein